MANAAAGGMPPNPPGGNNNLEGGAAGGSNVKRGRCSRCGNHYHGDSDCWPACPQCGIRHNPTLQACPPANNAGTVSRGGRGNTRSRGGRGGGRGRQFVPPSPFPGGMRAQHIHNYYYLPNHTAGYGGYGGGYGGGRGGNGVTAAVRGGNILGSSHRVSKSGTQRGGGGQSAGRGGQRGGAGGSQAGKGKGGTRGEISINNPQIAELFRRTLETMAREGQIQILNDGSSQPQPGNQANDQIAAGAANPGAGNNQGDGTGPPSGNNAAAGTENMEGVEEAEDIPPEPVSAATSPANNPADDNGRPNLPGNSYGRYMPPHERPDNPYQG
ncbi:hypothetical protein G7Y79_00001g000010 [Physcia stellaris]|nr:hypothetical protein G7Y79_00001g000010 [Physcia stellaris]